MKLSYRVVLCSVVVLAIALFSASEQLDSPLRQLLTYQTSSSRMVLTNNLCANYPRWSAPPSDTLSLNKEYLAHMNATIPVNGNRLLNKMFDNLGEAPALMVEQAKGFGLWIGPFLLAFVLTLFIWPFLACCCCCPGCCPPSCCRQKDGDLYSKCEMRWPAVVLSLALMLAISSGAYGFTKANVMSESVIKLGCAGSMIADDLLNGNVTSDGSSYFTGLNMLNTQLGWFSGNLTTITTQLNNFDSANTNVTSALTLGNTLLTNIKNIDGNTGGGMATIAYAAPISANSQFPALLATSTTPGLLLDYYQGPQIVIAKLQGIANNVHSFIQASSGIAGNVNSVQSLLTSPITTVNDYDKKEYIDTMKVFADYGTMGYQALYAAIMGLSGIALFGTWLMCCCGKDRCRYLVYFSCFFMFFLVIATTLITTIFSTLMPPFAWGCEYINASFTDKFEFDYNFRGMPVEMRDYVSTCMSYGSGDLLGKFSVDSLSTLTNLTSAFSVLNNFNIPTINTELTNNHTAFLATIDNYGRSKKSDLASSTPLLNIASRSGYSCSDSNFGLDSYVPSISQITNYVPCSASGSAGITACTGNFNPKGGSCAGCLDVAEIFNANATAADVKAAVWGRYGNTPNCQAFAIDLSNMWASYYYTKQQLIGNSINTVATSVYGRASALTPDINAFKASLTTLNTAQTSVNSSLSSLNNLLDPQYGMLGGLNCKVFGQDVQRVISTACVDTFNSIFIVRLALGISSLAMFFSLCCAVCAGSRHFRQSNCRSSKVENSSQDIHEKTKPYKPEETLETMRPR